MALAGGLETSGPIDLNESDSFDINAVNKLFQEAYAEEKQSTIELEGNISSPRQSKTTKYHRTRTLSGYDSSTHPQSRHSNSRSRNDSSVSDDDHNTSSVPAKVYCIAGYRILLHLLLLYCVLGVTYLLLMHTDQFNDVAHCECTEVKTDSGSQLYTTYNNNTASCECTSSISATPSVSPSESPSKLPTAMPTKIPTKKPTESPTPNPTRFPSSNPSIAPTLSPTERPSEIPTERPTLQPTNGIVTFVGDYKVSAKTASHGGWKLCDGSFLDSIDYPELFEVIGNSFGAFSGYPSLFALPNKTNHIGMISYFETECPDGWQPFSHSDGRFILSSGDYSGSAEDNRIETKSYAAGETGGEIRHKLIIDEIPSHNHIVSGQDNNAVRSGAASNEVANVENYPSYFSRTTSSTGGGKEHNNMPPYLVLHACKYNDHRGNVFILAKINE